MFDQVIQIKQVSANEKLNEMKIFESSGESNSSAQKSNWLTAGKLVLASGLFLMIVISIFLMGPFTKLIGQRNSHTETGLISLSVDNQKLSDIGSDPSKSDNEPKNRLLGLQSSIEQKSKRMLPLKPKDLELLKKKLLLNDGAASMFDGPEFVYLLKIYLPHIYVISVVDYPVQALGGYGRSLC